MKDAGSFVYWNWKAVQQAMSCLNTTMIKIEQLRRGARHGFNAGQITLRCFGTIVSLETKGFFTVLSNTESNRCMPFLVKPGL